MPGIFSKIIAGDIPCYKVAEDDQHLAFLDISPLKEGHTLVIPKKEVDYLFDLDDALYVSLMAFSKRVALAIKASVDCEKVGVAVIGLEVPHAHIHLVPIRSVSDMNFHNAKLKLSKEEFAGIAAKISSNFK